MTARAKPRHPRLHSRQSWIYPRRYASVSTFFSLLVAYNHSCDAIDVVLDAGTSSLPTRDRCRQHRTMYLLRRLRVPRITLSPHFSLICARRLCNQAPVSVWLSQPANLRAEGQRRGTEVRFPPCAFGHDARPTQKLQPLTAAFNGHRFRQLFEVLLEGVMAMQTLFLNHTGTSLIRSQ